jgi:hypothetical protein
MIFIRTPMTYKQALLSYLPRSVAEAAINNRIREEGEGSERDLVPTLVQALSDAFIWKNSPQGQKYWEAVNCEFLNNLEGENE